MASTEVGSIHYNIDLEDKEFRQGIADASKKFQTFGDKLDDISNKFKSIGKAMTIGVTIPIIAGMGSAVKSASDLGETLNKVDVAFKDNANEVKAWGNTSIKNMGLAKQSALDMVALFGDMATSMGFNTNEASKMGMKLVQLAGDMASFKNISFERAQTALAGVFTGETEALKGLGIVMTQANLEAFALAQGIKKPMDQMTQAEKVTLRYKYVMKVTSNAQGDFARTADSTANRTRTFAENVKELQARLGENLLPIVNNVLEKLNNWIDALQKLTPEQQKLILVIAGTGASIGPVSYAVGGLASAFQGLFNIIKTGNVTMIAIVAVLTLLSIGAIWLYQNWELVKQKALELWNVLEPVLLPVLKYLKWAFDYLIQSLKEFWQLAGPVLGPALKWLAIIIGGVLMVAVIGITVAIATVVAIIGVLIQVIGFVIRFVVDLAVKFWEMRHSVLNAFKGIGEALILPFKIFFDFIEKGVNKAKEALSNLSPFKRHSPSLVDWVQRGTAQMEKDYGSFFDKIGNMSTSITPNMSEAVQSSVATTPSQPNVNISVDMSGIMATSQADIRDKAKILIGALNEELRAKGINQLGV